MSHKNESDPFAVKAREDWIVDAARAFIAVTTPAHRYMFVKEGFITFEQMARPMFAEMAGLKFSSSEIRRIYSMICGYAKFKEGHLQPFLAMAFEETRRRSWKADEESSSADTDQGEIETERVHSSGVAEKHAYRGKMRIQ